ncbi:hypothetical protein GCM10011409_45330 [Lentibacillus populi]|uniref:Uncharacterized protein n=1 Tax=Lentibacillus populi TaxID=1827502 RepID=A0A9W5U2J3_9BACI|nr:hypothetical protein [Lentibacillus populi]GGB63178.1 hypothetical protein GCM10011409_45330 [Lentibacillus populi]
MLIKDLVKLRGTKQGRYHMTIPISIAKETGLKQGDYLQVTTKEGSGKFVVKAIRL